MEQQKIWVCIGIGFVLLLAVLAAVLFSCPEGQLSSDVRFVSASEDAEEEACDQTPYAFIQNTGERVDLI